MDGQGDRSHSFCAGHSFQTEQQFRAGPTVTMIISMKFLLLFRSSDQTENLKKSSFRDLSNLIHRLSDTRNKMFNKAHASSVKSGMNSRIYRKTEPNKLDQLGEQMLLETVKLQLGFQTDVDLKISRI